ncbi:small subunit processome component 20 homolog [Ceratina calcarata]|uniref:Small subunit processome component 20 homolog n=1 Tax=Ceratina calcarata TaxID=156304 RepID=A0AAJ7J5W2_9HYME|nr:small subunit processome component 20 homolog [Ceratina calcarata]
MKTEPIRHKESNTFQFKRFSERVNEINVDVFHRVVHRNEENDDEVETHFHETLQKWNFLNLTEGYCSFKRKVCNIITLPQLINQKQFVVDTLIEYLEKKDVLFLQPMLDLVVALSKDLQKDFYEYFPRFLTIIIELLHTKDTEQLEYAFTSLAYLFKFLWRYLVKNVKTVLDLLLPLLGDAQPSYINDFAAESFAFVVRKIKDKDSFLKTILRILKTNPDGIPGCAKLLFEVISGTPEQFHSCAERMLSLYLNALNNESLDQSLMFELLKGIIESILNNIHPQKCQVFWSVFLSVVDTSIEKTKHFEQTSKRQKSLILLMQLLNTIVNYRNGRMIVEPVPLIKRLVQILDTFQDENDVLQEAMKLSVSILLASHVKLMQETVSQILLKVMSVKDIRLLYSAGINLVNYSSFETVVLPMIIRHSIAIGFDENTLDLFSNIIKVKAPLCLNGINLHKWKEFPLDIRGMRSESISYLQKELEGSLDESNIPENAIKMLIILPHLKPLPDSFRSTLKKAILSLYQRILSTDADNKLCLTFLIAVESAIRVLESESLHKIMGESDIQILDLIQKYPENKFILNAVDLCMTYFSQSQYRDAYVNEAAFDKLNISIVQKLSSPFSEVRLIVTHLYSLFSLIGSKIIHHGGVVNEVSTTAMEYIYLAECSPISVETVRGKLLNLNSLSFENSVIKCLPAKYYDFPLRYLLGTLYINFSLLWEPVSNIIATYATKDCEQFWPIFLNELTSSQEFEDYKPLFKCEIISEIEDRIQRSNDRPDCKNRQVLLWKCMANFSSFCEMKNRDITGLFIDYVNENFFKSNSEDSKYCSILKLQDSDANNMEIEAEDESNNQCDKEDEEKKEVPPIERKRAKKQLTMRKNYKLQLLLAQLEIFKQFTNPRTLYRESEMQKIYLDLLSSKDADIQTAALNCLLTYKFKYLLPYKENLLNIINDRSMKDELTRFKIDVESKMILDEDRDEFIPILMRIIYAKMVTRTGMKTGGMARATLRRDMFIRFLMGTEEREMLVFVNMAFKPFKRYASLELGRKINLQQVVKDIIDTVDLTNVMPPKRLQSAINLIGSLIEQFGSRMMEKLLPYLLALVICILAEVTGILQRSDKVHSGYLTSIKNARSSCITILARFFGHYENYEWTEYEIDALFDVAVFPWVEKLPMEGIHSPTPLLKLFMTWSQNSRYYPLFIKHRPDDKSISSLPYIIKLLLAPKVHPNVTNSILEMIQKMVTLQDYGKINEDDMEVDTPIVPLIPILNNLLEVNEKALREGVNYGSTILIPHVPSVLEFIKHRLAKSHRGIGKVELLILSRFSEFVNDSGASDALLSLSLPILIKKTRAGESEIITELIETVIHLVKQVKNPTIHMRAMLPLLGTVTAVPDRKLLLELYKTIVQRAPEESREMFMKNHELLIALNAWDWRWISQPDFQKRLDAFSSINNAIDKNEITLEFGVAIIHNCYYFLKNEGDLALRDNAGLCIKVLSSKLAKEYKGSTGDRRYLMDDTILPLIRRGITSKNEQVKFQSISFLGYMAMECPEVHPILRDLNSLTNKLDPEVDFFENMQHLQLHRRARALLKFCNVAKTLKKAPNPRTLTQFVLPLASSFLCNESYMQKNSIVDAAIESIGSVCKLLPWHQYEIILKHYLDKLKGSVLYQRQLVRIIVIILDSFHFDLSKYKPVEELRIVEKVKETEQKEEDGKADEENNDKTELEIEENLQEALNSEIIDNIEETEKTEKQEELVAVEKQIVLSESGAKKVIFSISKELLPQLHRSIIARTSHENSHKLNKKRVAIDNEEEELMRVPIALAFVKLLQKLPDRILDVNLPGIFMKLCTFLKSRLESVRRATREILQKIMITLGPKYLHHLLREMNTLLTRGFQVHVLAFTVQSVLSALKPHFQKFDINENLQSILSVCKVDLFGVTAEEKEVLGIVKNVSEAKSTKSFDIFHILSQYITETCLVDLILPLKEVLAKTHSHKTVLKVSECLRNIVLGLADNSFIPLEQMLIFLYGVISESIPELMPERKGKEVTEKAEVLIRQKPDCFIIPPEPKTRMGIKAGAKTSKNTNAHVITEFGLKLFHILLKRDKISNASFKPFIDPFVPVISECLKSQHVKLSTLGLQCLSWLTRMDLISIQDTISDICSSIFSLLHKYAAAGLSKGENFDLVMAGFKCMAVIVRDVKHYTITTNQLKVLIMYAEQDMHNSEKQATAFGLLKAIISRKIVFPEMYLVMEKVATLSITSELEHVRVQARSVFYSYLMEYPLGKHLTKNIMFYLTQLNYEMQPGRLSALEMLHSIVTGFPLKALILKSDLIFTMASTRLINDDDPTCRKLCAKCLKEMIARVPHNKRRKLFEIVVALLEDAKVMHRTLAAQLCGLFVTVENDAFESRLKEILPLLLKQFHASFDDEKPGRFVKLHTEQDEQLEMSGKVKDVERMKDHHMFQVLQLLLKISANCAPFLKNEEYRDSVRSFAEHSQSLLAHPHVWVRLAACQMIGFILAAHDVDKIVNILENPEKREEEISYMYSDPATIIRSLTLDLIAQLQPDMILEDLADQTVKNLIFIARILKSVKTINSMDEQDDKDKDQLSLSWLVRRLRKSVNVELAQAPKSISVRTAYFKWVAGAVATIPMSHLKEILLNIMSPIVREMSSTEETNSHLRRLAKEAATMIKRRLDTEEYTRLLSQVQRNLDIKKAERRKMRAQQFVTDPELAAKRKIAKQQKKKESRKRKLDTVRGKKVMRKRPRKEVDLDVI